MRGNRETETKTWPELHVKGKLKQFSDNFMYDMSHCKYTKIDVNKLWALKMCSFYFYNYLFNDPCVFVMERLKLVFFGERSL